MGNPTVITEPYEISWLAVKLSVRLAVAPTCYEFEERVNWLMLPCVQIRKIPLLSESRGLIWALKV